MFSAFLFNDSVHFTRAIASFRGRTDDTSIFFVVDGERREPDNFDKNETVMIMWYNVTAVCIDT